MEEKNYKKIVKEHYRNQAKIHGKSLTSTMPDQNIRRLEIETIIKYIKNNKTCLEVGCGNGAASLVISSMRTLDLLSVDFSNDMIEIAKKQSKNEVKGKLNFELKNVLELDIKRKFDLVFTIRCIINLMSWKDQKKALENMSKVVKKGGFLILLEAFSDGLEELNQARKEFGFSPIPPAHHNLHLKKELVINLLKEKDLELIEENNFLSSYYFFTRVLYPALAKGCKVDTVFNSKIDSFFSYFPPHGNFAHIKLLLFKKIK